MAEKDILAEIAKCYLLKEDTIAAINRLDQKINQHKIELMKVRSNANDAHDAEPVGSASGKRDS
jgi:hypothetical protein